MQLRTQRLGVVCACAVAAVTAASAAKPPRLPHLLMRA